MLRMWETAISFSTSRRRPIVTPAFGIWQPVPQATQPACLLVATSTNCGSPTHSVRTSEAVERRRLDRVTRSASMRFWSSAKVAPWLTDSAGLSHLERQRLLEQCLAWSAPCVTAKQARYEMNISAGASPSMAPTIVL